tara:strand:+ start:623 stop:1066 length:444 start_codon:yes stop_codon:yes gene_type:complete
MYYEILKLCIVVAGWSYQNPYEQSEASNVCVEIALEAKAQDVPVEEALALAWAESRFKPKARSHKGAQGPMQVIPRWWCIECPCDYVEAGVKALKAFKRLYPGFKNTICHYNNGVEKDCPHSSIGFANAVDKYRKKIKKQMKKEIGK